MLDQIFEQFARQAPVPVMMRAILENILSPTRLNAVFDDTAQQQYTRQLTFDAVVALLAEVVTKRQASVYQAYRARREQLAVSAKALYDKIDGTEPETAKALAARTAREMELVTRALGGAQPALLPGYRTKILDGTHFAATDRRLALLRAQGACLPGHVLAVLDPALQMILAIEPCEDAHTQERALVPEILKTAEANDLWIADRNFCTAKLMFGLAARGAFFIVRHHAQSYRWKALGDFDSDAAVAEQPIVVYDERGAELRLRRVRVRLPEPTRDGDTELLLLTNLPMQIAAAVIARLYRSRWKIESAFQEATVDLTCEIASLGHPRAAILVFAVAVVCFNALQLLKAALRVRVAEEARTDAAREVAPSPAAEPSAIADPWSTYYLAQTIASVWEGMRISLPDPLWNERFADLNHVELADRLRSLAQNVRLDDFRKRRRTNKPSPRRPPPKPGSHASTARLLNPSKHKK
jgi:hypothetical protein